MTRDDIVRMVEELGLVFRFDYYEIASHNADGIMIDDLTKFAKLVAAIERESCAKLMDDMDKEDNLSNYYKVAANKIRARGNNDL